MILARTCWLASTSCLSLIRLVGLRTRLSLPTLSCQRGRHGSARTMHKLWSAIQAMITAFTWCLRHSAFLYTIQNLPFNMPYARSETTIADLNFLLKYRSFRFFVLGRLSGARGVNERHCPPPSLEEFAHTQIRLVPVWGSTWPDFILWKIGEDYKRVESSTEPGALTPAQRNLLMAAINLLFITDYLFLKLKNFFKLLLM